MAKMKIMTIPSVDEDVEKSQDSHTLQVELQNRTTAMIRLGGF